MIPATVTSVAPLEVLLDGAATPSPAVLVSGAVELNARVYVEPSTSPLQVTGGLPVGLVTQDEVDALEAELLAVAGGKLAKTANLADLTDAAEARANLGLDEDGATGGALLRAQNLDDLQNKATARDNLGLGTAARKDHGTAEGTVPLLGAGGRLARERLPATLDAPTFATLVKLGAA